ncbi:MAG: ABC transporter permease subunit [Nitriliruptorales bacterium]|nr:ABC transporter permease subunit [Nitriliruptorales bacterium]
MRANAESPTTSDTGETPPALITEADPGASWVRRAGPPVVLFVMFITVWELAVRLELISSYLLASPTAIVGSFFSLLSSGILLENAYITMLETVGGFVVGSGMAFLLAVACGLSKLLRKMLYPWMVALQVTPRVAVAPMLIAALGFGYSPKIVLGALICFFVVFLNTLTGFMSVDEDALELFRSLGASRWKIFTQLLLPGAMVMTFAGLKTGITLALIGAIVAEFESARDGLGVLIQTFSFQLNIEAAFAVLLSLTGAGLILYGIIEYLDRVVVFWARDESTSKRTQRHAARAQSR